jgi:hypothetical protein
MDDADFLARCKTLRHEVLLHQLSICRVVIGSKDSERARQGQSATENVIE